MEREPDMFNKIDTGTINDAIKLGTAKATRGLRFVTDSDRADIAQTAWIKILEHYNPFKAMLVDGYSPDTVTRKTGETFTKSALGSFAFRVAFNAGVDFLRGHKGARLDSRHDSIDATFGEDGQETLGSIMPSSGPNPLQALVAKRRDAAVTVALSNLSEAEIAVCLADSDRPATVAERVRKTRAIDKLQESIVAA